MSFSLSQSGPDYVHNGFLRRSKGRTELGLVGGAVTVLLKQNHFEVRMIEELFFLFFVLKPPKGAGRTG